MTHEQKIEYMRMAEGIVGFRFQEQDLDLLVSIYELIIKKEGKTTISDVADVKHAVAERWREKERKDNTNAQ